MFKAVLKCYKRDSNVVMHDAFLELIFELLLMTLLTISPRCVIIECRECRDNYSLNLLIIAHSSQTRRRSGAQFSSFNINKGNNFSQG